MNKSDHRDVASFPELFDGMEAFLDEEARALKKTSLYVLIALSGIVGSVVLFAIFKAA